VVLVVGAGCFRRRCRGHLTLPAQSAGPLPLPPADDAAERRPGRRECNDTRSPSSALGAFRLHGVSSARSGVANLPLPMYAAYYLDLVPMAALASRRRPESLNLAAWLIRGRRALRVDVGFSRFLLLGPDDGHPLRLLCRSAFSTSHPSTAAAGA